MTGAFTASAVTPPHEGGDSRFLPDRLILRFLMMNRCGVMGRRCFRTRGDHNGGNRGGGNGRPNGDRARGDPGSSACTRSSTSTSRTRACSASASASTCACASASTGPCSCTRPCAGSPCTGSTGSAFSGRQCLQGNRKRYEEQDSDAYGVFPKLSHNTPLSVNERLHRIRIPQKKRTFGDPTVPGFVTRFG